MTIRRVCVLLTAVAVPLGAFATSVAVQTFTDVPDTAWYAPFVAEGVRLGIASGYKDAAGNSTGRFGPENTVTIAEALKISLESAGYDVTRGIGYGHWAAKYLSVAVGEHFALAQVTQLNLDRQATRAEVASLISDAFKVRTGNNRSTIFTDVDIGDAFAPSIGALQSDGVLSGDKNSDGKMLGTFRPRDFINRAETVKIAIAARAKYGQPGLSSSASSTFVCTPQDCGPSPLMPNVKCADGTTGGPSCEMLTNNRCGWVIRQCAASSSSSRSSSSSSSSSSRSSSSSSSSSSKRAVQTYDIQYVPTGFVPSLLSIHVGDIVRFKNLNSGIGMWVASNPHPTHTDYPEFDAHAASGSGGTFSFTFTKIGGWGYHNHLRQNNQAVIVVDQ